MRPRRTVSRRQASSLVTPSCTPRMNRCTRFGPHVLLLAFGHPPVQPAPINAFPGLASDHRLPTTGCNTVPLPSPHHAADESVRPRSRSLAGLPVSSLFSNRLGALHRSGWPVAGTVFWLALRLQSGFGSETLPLHPRQSRPLTVAAVFHCPLRMSTHPLLIVQCYRPMSFPAPHCVPMLSPAGCPSRRGTTGTVLPVVCLAARRRVLVHGLSCWCPSRRRSVPVSLLAL